MEIQYIGIIVFVVMIILVFFNFLQLAKEKKDDFKEQYELEQDELDRIDNLIYKRDDGDCSSGIILAVFFSLLAFSGIGIPVWIGGIIYLNSENAKGKYSSKCWKKIVIILLMPVIITPLLFGGCLIAITDGL